jgi:hypothetical protein
MPGRKWYYAIDIEWTFWNTRWDATLDFGFWVYESESPSRRDDEGA